MAKPSEFPFLDDGQELIIFFNGCLDVSANLLIGSMGPCTKWEIVYGIISSQRPAFFHLTVQTRSMIHRHKEIWK